MRRLDGRLLWRDRIGPLTFARGRGWDTRTVPTGAAEGQHELTVDARTAGGRRAARVVPVVVHGDLAPTLGSRSPSPNRDFEGYP